MAYKVSTKRTAPGVARVYIDSTYIGNVYKTTAGWRHGHSYADYPTRKAAAQALVNHKVTEVDNNG